MSQVPRYEPIKLARIPRVCYGAEKKDNLSGRRFRVDITGGRYLLFELAADADVDLESVEFATEQEAERAARRLSRKGPVVVEADD